MFAHKAMKIQQQTIFDDNKHLENAEEEEKVVESVLVYYSGGILRAGLQGLHCLQGGPGGNQEGD